MTKEDKYKRLEAKPLGYVIDVLCRMNKIDTLAFCDRAHAMFGNCVNNKLILHWVIGGIRRTNDHYLHPSTYSVDNEISRLKDNSI